MATWTIQISAQSGQGSGASGTHATTLGEAQPADFDNATITSVSVSGSPSTTVSGAGNDEIGVRFIIETSTGTDIYGSTGSDAATMCYAPLDTAGSTIVDGTSTSPAPTTAVAADWDNVYWEINYSANAMPDGQTLGWSQFDVVVTYTPAGAINNVTITGDNNYAATTDDSIELRERTREISDTELSNLVTDDAIELRERNRENAEYFPVHGDALVFDNVFSTAQRFRDRELTDTELQNLVTDDKTATYTPGDGPTVNNVTLQDLNSCAVNDLIVPLRLRDREQTDTSVVTDNDVSFKEARREQTDNAVTTDNNLQLRERSRAQADDITVEDVSTELRESNNEIIETIDPNDDSIELRERNRQQADTSAVTDSDTSFKEARRDLSDSITATDNDVSFREHRHDELDSVTATDNNIELRERNRALADSIVVEDAVDPTYVPAGAVINNVTLQDLDSCTVTDTSIELRLRDREQTESADVTDTSIGIREHRSVDADSVTVDDVTSLWIENNEQQTETIDPNDDSIELRERNRGLSDSIVVGDDATATYVPVGTQIYNVTLQDLDSCAVNDSALTLRERIRQQSDDAIVVDAVVSLRARSRASTDSIATTTADTSYATRGRQRTDSLDLSETTQTLRERLRNITDDAALTDAVIVTVDTEITNATLTDQLSVSDNVTATRVTVIPTFNALTGVETLSVEYGIIPNLQIDNGLFEETS